MEQPKVLPLSKGMDPDEKAAALKLYDEQLLASAYRHLLAYHAKPLFEAVAYEESTDSGVVDASRNLFEVGEAYCLGSIAEMKDSPVQFSETEMAKIVENAERTAASMNAMNVIKNALSYMAWVRYLALLHS